MNNDYGHLLLPILIKTTFTHETNQHIFGDWRLDAADNRSGRFVCVRKALVCSLSHDLPLTTLEFGHQRWKLFKHASYLIFALDNLSIVWQVGTFDFHSSKRLIQVLNVQLANMLGNFSIAGFALNDQLEINCRLILRLPFQQLVVTSGIVGLK
jgi:hypothetical protein